MTAPHVPTPEALHTLVLRSGVGSGKPNDRCAMQEVRAWLDLDPSKDTTPDCVCPVIGKLVIGLNDAGPVTRAALTADGRPDGRTPVLLRILGTRSTPAVEHARSLLALDWLVRTYTPAFLDMVPSLTPHAAALRALDPITDDNAAIAGVVVSAAESAARSAAWSAATGALAPTVATLQVSAADLLERLLGVSE